MSVSCPSFSTNSGTRLSILAGAAAGPYGAPRARTGARRRRRTAGGLAGLPRTRALHTLRCGDHQMHHNLRGRCEGCATTSHAAPRSTAAPAHAAPSLPPAPRRTARGIHPGATTRAPAGPRRAGRRRAAGWAVHAISTRRRPTSLTPAAVTDSCRQDASG